MPILLEGQKLVETKMSSRDFLRRNPSGPYTSLVALKNGAVPFWNDHISRLQHSLQYRTWPATASIWSESPWETSEAVNVLQTLNLRKMVDESSAAVQQLEQKETDVSMVILLKQSAR